MNVMIVGGGKVGEYLTDYLLKTGHRVKLIENHREDYNQLIKAFPRDVVVLGNGSDPDVLEASGIRKVDVVAAVTGTDEVNLVVTSLARFEFEVPRIIARVNHPKNAWMFTKEMGVDVALNQADLIATMIAEEMSLGDMILIHKLRKGQFSLVEEKVTHGSIANGKSIKELKLPPECIFTAVIRKGEMLVPHGSLVLQEMDEVIAVVHSSKLQALAKVLGEKM
jgi:trk system potassium uptake protein TrkA